MKKKYLAKLEEDSESINQLSIVHINARGAVNKLEEVEALAEFASAHILCITESWFAEDVNYTLKNYECFVSMSSSRSEWKYGGAVIFVRRDVVDNFKLIKINHKTSLDSQIVGIESSKFKLCIFVCYRSPSQTAYSEITKFLDDVEKLELPNINEFIFLGDLNMRTAYGPGFEANGCKVSGPYKRIYDYFEDMDVEQPIQEPTHVDGNTLDIFWCSPLVDIHKAGVYSDYYFESDHLPIYLVINLDKSLTKISVGERRKVTDWEKVDFKGYRKELLQKQNRLCGMANMIRDGKMDVDLSAATLNDEIILIWNKHAPTKWITVDNKAFSAETRAQIKKLKEVSKHNHRRSDVVRKESKILSELIANDKKVKAEERLAKIVRERDSIYAYFKDARRGENRVGPFVDPNTNKLSECNEEMGTMLNGHYKSIWNKNAKIKVDDQSRPEWWHIPMSHCFDYEGNVDVSEHDLRVAMKKVKRRVGIGSDGLTGWMIKEAIEPLLLPLLVLLKNMIYWGIWPHIYKIADVIPLRKGDVISDNMNDTRPISLTALIGKIFERVLIDKYLCHIRFFDNGRFNIKDNQFGFMKGRCVSDNLTMTINKINCILEAGETCDLILIDIRKGFDTVCYQNLASDLRDAGLYGKIFNLWKSWMTGRQQRVKIGDTYSDYVEVTGGTPQGTSAGPVFFLTYLNEAIPDERGVGGKLKKYNTEEERLSESAEDKRKRIVNETSVYSYADDSKIAGSSKNHVANQAVLDGFQRWADKKHMKCNPKKTTVFYIGNGNPKYKYFLDGQELAESENVRDLGLFYNFDASKNRLCYLNTVKKRLKDCRVILKLSRNIISCKRNSIDHFIHAYQTYVFPQLYTFSEFFFFETQDECDIVDDVFKSFFSNLDFVFSDLKSFPYAPSAILKKLAQIRFWRMANSMTGCDAHDLFTFIGVEGFDKNGKRTGHIRDKIKYPALIPDYKRSDSRSDALIRNFPWRLIPWWNNIVPHELIERKWVKFKSWIETEAYILHDLHTPKSLELRNKIISGHFSDIRKRKSRHIQESKRCTAEEVERRLNEACNRIRIPITPLKIDSGSSLTISKDLLNCIVSTPDGEEIVSSIGGAVSIDGASVPEKVNKTPEGAQVNPRGKKPFLSEAEQLKALSFPYLEEHEDGTIPDSPGTAAEATRKHDDTKHDLNRERILGNGIPGKRIRNQRRASGGQGSQNWTDNIQGYLNH